MKQYIVDAFTDKIFSGNSAAICILEEWISDEVMLSIAVENNLSETAFAVKDYNRNSDISDLKGYYKLRWFTPGGEIDLCGHATLACAFVIINYYEKKLKTVVFDTLSGDLTVNKIKGSFENENLYEMNFPEYELKPIEITDEMIELIGEKPVEAYLGRDLMCVFENEDSVLNAKLDMEKVKKLEGLLLHITAKYSGKSKNKIRNKVDKIDCISRSFAPKLNVPEDPVCGSGHCHIAPYWIKKLQKENIVAYQASDRSGTLYCKLLENKRVQMSGKAVLFAISEIFV